MGIVEENVGVIWYLYLSTFMHLADALVKVHV